MNRAVRFAPEISDFENQGEEDFSPAEPKEVMDVALSPLNEFFVALTTAAQAVEQEPPRVPCSPYELPVSTGLEEAKRLHNSWHVDEPEGLEKRGCAHMNQLCKHTTGSVSRYDLTVDYTYESVSVGVIVVSWSQVWGNRRGFGFIPYFRYLTSGGASATYHSVSEVPREYGGPNWDPNLEDYIAQTGMEESKKEALRAVIRAVFVIEPFIIGWHDTETGKDSYAWSDGDAAEKTILQAMKELREQDMTLTEILDTSPYIFAE